MSTALAAGSLASRPLQQPFRRSTCCAAARTHVCQVLAPERELLTVRQDPSEHPDLASHEPLVLWTPRGDAMPLSQPADPAQRLRELGAMPPDRDDLQTADSLWLSEADMQILRRRATAAADAAAAEAVPSPPPAEPHEPFTADAQLSQPAGTAAAVGDRLARATVRRAAAAAAPAATQAVEQDLLAGSRARQTGVTPSQPQPQRARGPPQDQVQQRTAANRLPARQRQPQQQTAQRARSPLLSQHQPSAGPALLSAAQQQQRKQQSPNAAQRQRTNAGQQLSRRAAPPLQQAVRSNSRHDWQVTRDWLVMEMTDMHLDDSIWAEVSKATGLPKSTRPVVALYHKMGLKTAELIRMANYRDQTFRLSLPMVQSRLNFLREEIGFSNDELRKMMLKFPRIIEYRTERTLRPRLDWLKQQGVQQADLVKILAKTPSILELSVEDTLEPRAAFLREVAMVPADSIAKVLLRSPSCLTCTVDLMQERVDFLRHHGFTDAQLSKAVTAHPQMLYYRVESMEERVDYLRSIGISDDDLATVIVKLPQLLSLDVRDNMMPKFDYLRGRLGGTVRDVAMYPAYFSLSLQQRIVPRHLYLEEVQRQRLWPFPIKYLKVSDERFASHIANSTLDSFESFRMQLLSGGAPSGRMQFQRQ